MLIDLSRVLSDKDRIEQVKTDITLEVFKCRMGEYPFTGERTAELTVTNISSSEVMVEGEICCSLLIPCDRCLEDVTNDFTIKVSKEISLSEETFAEDNFETTSIVEDKQLDVDKLAYNEILVNLPMKVLCNSDCKGICNRCGTNLNRSTCDCDTTELDPRMSKILDIFNQFKEV